MPGDVLIHRALCVVLVILSGLAFVTLLSRWYVRWRPRREMLLVCVGILGVRVACVLALEVMGDLGDTLRGTDDPAFLHGAEAVAAAPAAFGGWGAVARADPMTAIIAAQIVLLGDPGAFVLRLTQAVLGGCGICLVVTGVHQFAGRTAALVAGLLLAIEPSGLLFSTILQKEALILLGQGAAILGIAMALHGARRGWLLVVLGVSVVLFVRPYAGAFLGLGCLAVTLHLALRRASPRQRLAVAGGAVLAAAASLLLAQPQLQRALDVLQEHQSDPATGEGALELAPVDYTTPAGLVAGTVRRMGDFLLRPPPWQLANAEQQAGAVGTVIAWLLLGALVVGLVVAGRNTLRRGWPLLYLAVPVTVGYAVTSVNAGTGFRHRMHLLVFVIALAAIAWSAAGGRAPWPAPRGRRAKSVGAVG